MSFVKKTSIALVDSHVSVRGMVRLVLDHERDPYEVVGEAGSGTEAIHLLGNYMPEIVILDLLLPNMCGLDVLTHIRSNLKTTKIIVFSSTQNEELIAESLRLNPHAFIHKRESLDVFREALRLVRKGGRYFTPFASDIADRHRGLPNRQSWLSLSSRERCVLQMVAEGKRSAEIAKQLCLSDRTVDHYRTQLMRKLELNNVAGLTRYAVRHGIVSLE